MMEIRNFFNITMEDVEEKTSLIKIYEQIFSNKNGDSIYNRRNSGYESEFEITSEDIEKIYQFLKKIALYMWRNKPDEAMIDWEDYESIAQQVTLNEKVHDCLIGRYLVKGEKSREVCFVHRSMYQYLVALSIFESIEDMINRENPKEQFQKLIKNYYGSKTSYITTFAQIIGMNLINSDSDIEQFLLYMLKSMTIKDDHWWKEFFECFLKMGLTRYVDNYEESSMDCLDKELNRFYNLIWLTREQLRNIDAIERYYKVAEVSTSFCYYLRQRKLIKVSSQQIDLSQIDLSDMDLRGADLKNVNLSGADLRGADLRGANLSGANLKNVDLKAVNLVGADLSGANLSGADLNGVNFQGVHLEEADFREAKLRGAQLYEAYLKGADFRKCVGISILNSADIDKIKADKDWIDKSWII